MKIVFLGTPQFSAATLDYMLQAGLNVVGVVSKPDKPKGRSSTPVPTPVKEIILQKYPEIPFFQPNKVSDPLFASTLEALDADLFVVVAYGEILRDHLLNMPKIACINVHTSLLPKFRGAAPIQRAIMSGESETGVSIMHLSKKMDEGDVILQKKIEISPDMTYGELQNKLLEVSCPALIDAIKWLGKSKAPRVQQDHEKATLAHKVELEECEIIWTKPAQELHNLIRGTNPEPGAWCWVTFKEKKLRLKLYQSKIRLNETSLSAPGEQVSWGKQGWVIATATNPLELIEVQLEGKKRMSAQDLMRGFRQQDFQFNI